LRCPVRLCKHVIRDPPVNSDEHDFVNSVELKSEAHLSRDFPFGIRERHDCTLF